MYLHTLYYRSIILYNILIYKYIYNIIILLIIYDKMLEKEKKLYILFFFVLPPCNKEEKDLVVSIIFRIFAT